MIGLTAQLFSIAQGFVAVLVLAIIAFVLFAAFAFAMTVLERLRAPGRPREPVKLRLVQPEPAPKTEPEREDDAWVKDFG